MAEINEIENRKTTERMNKTKCWFFKQTNKIDKFTARSTTRERENMQITKIRMKVGATKIKMDSKRAL